MDTSIPTSVLLLDDEQLLLDLYVDGFKSAGYAPVAFTSGNDALETLRSAPAPRVILFDIHMPDMNGFEFLEAVKKEGLAPESLMIALTNESKEEDTKRIMDLGASGHFVKSQLSPKDLVGAVQGLLEKPAA
ncbi:MAG: response regulator [Candidatus Pacebacteria bacterium]|nr:response regulator [Candidatus Paceibacterota bacterium]